MFCPKCGTDAGSGKFCPSCGSPLNESLKKPANKPQPAVNLNAVLVNRKIIVIATVLIVLVGISVLAMNMGGLGKDKAENMVQSFYLALENGEYDKLENLLTPEARRDEKGIVEMIEDVGMFSDYVKLAVELNALKYDVKYVNGSFHKLGKGEYTATYNVSHSSNFDKLKSYISKSEMEEGSTTVSFTFKKIDKQWYISEIN